MVERKKLMKKTYLVEFSVTYLTRVECGEDESLDDVISDIDIPEKEGIEYLDDTFTIEHVSVEK